MPRPLAVAVTGGIGAGKSEALRAFERHGAPVLSSDEVVHRLYADPEVRAAVVGRWGERVLDPQGAVDRRAVGEIVFGDRNELAWLEALLHPRVAAENERWRAELAARPDPPTLCVTEVPLLFEAGGEERFDVVVVVTAPEHLRRSRSAVARVEREARLVPDEEKVRRADYAYVNDGSLEELDAFVERVVAELTARVA